MSRLSPPFGRPAARTIATCGAQVGDRAAGLRFQRDEQPVFGRAVTEPGETLGGRLPRFAGERAHRHHVSSTDRVRKFEGELLASQAVGVASLRRVVPPQNRLDLDQVEPVVPQHGAQVGVGPSLRAEVCIVADMHAESVEASPARCGHPLRKCGGAKAAVGDDDLRRCGCGHRATTVRLPSRHR